MNIARSAIRSLENVGSLRPFRPIVSRSLSTNADEDPRHNRSSFDSSDDRLFGDGNDDNTSGFFQHLGKAEKDKRDFSLNRSRGSSRLFNIDENFDPSSDGMEGKLKDAALFPWLGEGEGVKDGYSFRPDVNRFGGNPLARNNFKRQMHKPRQNNSYEVTTEEVLRKADFRNVKFLAQFITEAGIIIKRKQTGISAKAQRKIAREIKTARAFGLMPFTTMGTKAFTFGTSMENKEDDFEYEALDDDDDEFDNPIA